MRVCGKFCFFLLIFYTSIQFESNKKTNLFWAKFLLPGDRWRGLIIRWCWRGFAIRANSGKELLDVIVIE